MANTTRWVVDTAYAANNAGFTATDFNSLANGSGVVAATAIANGTPLDQYCDVSFTLVVGGTTTAPSYLTLYLLPLNQDGTTYGDGTASGSSPPTPSYQVSSVSVRAGVTTGNTIVGTFRGIVLPPGSFKLAIVNQLGVALNAAAAAGVAYRSYNENLNV